MVKSLGLIIGIAVLVVLMWNIWRENYLRSIEPFMHPKNGLLQLLAEERAADTALLKMHRQSIFSLIRFQSYLT